MPSPAIATMTAALTAPAMPKHPPGSHLLANQRIAARKIGISIDDYLAQRAKGLTWCGGCRRWVRRARRGACYACQRARSARRRRELGIPERGARGPYHGAAE